MGRGYGEGEGLDFGGGVGVWGVWGVREVWEVGKDEEVPLMAQVCHMPELTSRIFEVRLSGICG